MEKEEQAERVRAVVSEILAVADMSKVTTREVRDLAAEKTGIDLSRNREWKSFVTNVIEKHLESIIAKSENLKSSPDEKKPRIREAFRDSSSEKMKKTEEMEDVKKKEDVSEQEYEDDEEEARGEGKRPKYEVDEDGNHTICTLSGQRKVVVSQWKGKTLISIRAYYEKDGKTLPSAKGINLTAEQFATLASVTNDIDRAISSMQ